MVKTDDKVGKFIQTVLDCKIPDDLDNLFLINQSQFIKIQGQSITILEWSKYGMLNSIDKDRGKLLDNFGKFEFLINQFLALKIVEFDYWNRHRIDEMIDKLNFYAKTELLQKWNAIPSKLKNKIDKVMKLRNQLAHSFDISEVMYADGLIEDKTSNAFTLFKNDMNDVWKDTISAYVLVQEKIDIEKLIQKIQDHNKKP